MTRRGAFGLPLACAFLVGALVIATLPHGAIPRQTQSPVTAIPNSPTPITTPASSGGASAAVIAPELPIPSTAFPLPIASLSIPISDSDGEHGLTLLANEDRRLSHVAPLRPTVALSVLAHERTADLVRTGYHSHCAGNPETDISKCPRTGLALLLYVTPQDGLAEVIAWVAVTDPGDLPVAMNNLWVNSPDHHRAIVDPQYHQIGAALTCCTGGGNWWVAVLEVAGSPP